MPTSLDWLPPLITLSDHDGKFDPFLEAVYKAFCDDFVHSKPSYDGKPFGLKKHPIELNKEATFWHVVSQGSTEADRNICLQRCERIRWPRPIIEAAMSGKVRIWKNSRRSEDRIVLAVDDFSYVVVLAERAAFVLLWTAYIVEQDHSRRQKEYEAWNAAPKEN